MHLRIELFVVLGLILFSTASIRAQNSENLQSEDAAKPGQHPQVKETIVVTATRSERSLDEVPMSTTILDGEEIQTMSGFGPDNIIKAVPSAYVKPSSSTMIYPAENKASMRGVPGPSMLVMVDGIPLNDPHRGYIPWNKLIIDTIERVEAVRGSSASLFGNYASGGAINLITRRITSDRFDARASWGTANTGQLGLQLEKTVSGRLGFGLNLQGFETDGYLRPLPELRGPIDRATWSKNRNFLTRVDYNPSPGLRTRFRVNWFNDKRGQGQPSSFNERTNYDVALSGHQAVSTNGDLAFALFYQLQDFNGQNVRLSAERDAEFVANNQFFDVESIGGSLQWTRSLSTRVPLVSYGIDTLFVEASELQKAILPAPQKTGTGGEQTSAGLFGETSWTPSERIEILLSGRVDYWRSFNGYHLPATGIRTEYSAKESIELSPRLTIRRQLSDRTAVRGSLYRAFNAPRLRDIYQATAGRGREAVPNPDLGPEIIVGGEVGFMATQGRGQFEVNAFLNQISNTINDVVLAFKPIHVTQVQNVGESEALGIELIGSVSLNSSWMWTGSYSYTDTEITHHPAEPQFEGNQLPDIPEHQVLSAIRFIGPRGFTAEFRGRYLAEIKLDAANEEVLDAHTIFDLSSSIAINDRLQLFVIGSNLFDEQYIGEITIEERLGAPRQFFGGLRYSLPY